MPMPEALLASHAVAAREGAAPAPALLPLEVRGLRVAAGGKSLLDGIDLTVRRGPTVVMGPNGAGKSLLLRALHGLLPVDGGTISWNGASPDEARPRQALVFQRPVLLRRSVAANLDFVLSLRGRADPKARDALLARAELLPLADAPARRLSGGEQQRLALARALATEPDMLLLDEPTASLDPASTLAIERLVGEAASAGTGVIWVTHDIGQARRLAHDVVFLARGRTTEHTEAAAFFERPVSEEARAYLEGRIVL